MLQDIAISVGGTAIFEDMGIRLENVELADLGTAKKLVVDKGQHHDYSGWWQEG